MALAAVALLGGCSKQEYAGDGRLIDRGWTQAHERYWAEVAVLDLTRTGSQTYRMTGLPPTLTVLGLQVPGRVDRGSGGGTPTTADVSLELTQENYGVVALITGPLRDWSWAPSAEADSAFAFQPKASSSYFDAFSDVHYRLKVTVNVADPAIPAGTLVVMKSGGWK
jgi:hypothetical protein